MIRSKIVKIFVVVFCVSLTGFCFARPLNSASFFPLQIGNTWGFVSSEQPPVFYTYTFSVDDTTQINNKLYYSSQNPFFFLGKDDYFRVDSLGNFVALRNDEEMIYFNFNMNVGDSLRIFPPDFPDTGYTYCVDKKEVTTFTGTPGWQIDFFMHHQSFVEAAKKMHFQEGVGPVLYTLTTHDLPMKLQWAIIDGVLYGDTGVPNDNYQPFEPGKFTLSQNYPNPFNSTTKISFNVSGETWVTLKLFDLLGKEVETLIDHQQLSGVQGVTWNGRNDFGETVSSGLYFYRLRADGQILTRKLMFMKQGIIFGYYTGKQRYDPHSN